MRAFTKERATILRLGRVSAMLAVVGLGLLGALWVLMFVAAGCVTPGPVPPVQPDAAQTEDVPARDRFWRRTFDCHGQNLEVRARALSAATACLDGSEPAPDPDSCLLGLSYDDRSIACAVRDSGASANAAVLSGAGANLQRVADNARAWIEREELWLQ